MKICVVGIGYVGLVTAACLAEAGNDVVCVDKDADKIAGLKNGVIPIHEPGLTEIVKRNEQLNRLHFTTDLKYGLDNSLVVFLAVGTPSTPDGSDKMQVPMVLFWAIRRVRGVVRWPGGCLERPARDG